MKSVVVDELDEHQKESGHEAAKDVLLRVESHLLHSDAELLSQAPALYSSDKETCDNTARSACCHRACVSGHSWEAESVSMDKSQKRSFNHHPVTSAKACERRNVIEIRTFLDAHHKSASPSDNYIYRFVLEA